MRGIWKWRAVGGLIPEAFLEEADVKSGLAWMRVTDSRERERAGRGGIPAGWMDGGKGREGSLEALLAVTGGYWRGAEMNRGD